MKLLPVLCGLLMLTAAALPASAGVAALGAVFSDDETTIIRSWYRENAPRTNGKARGRKGRGALPPGIAKNLRRGKPLPPGIARQALPGDLIARLPPAPRGYERIELAGRILLVEVATQVIHDVLEDAILR